MTCHVISQAVFTRQDEILAWILSLEIDFREKKVLSMPMFRWCCLKKCFKWFFWWWNTASGSCCTFIWQLQMNKEFTGKSSLTSFFTASSEKNFLGALYFTNWKVLQKRRSLRIICRFLKEELQLNQVKTPFVNWLFEKWICLSIL